MLASELIEELTRLIDAYGDLQVRVANYNRGYYIETVEYSDSEGLLVSESCFTVD